MTSSATYWYAERESAPVELQFAGPVAVSDSGHVSSTASDSPPAGAVVLMHAESREAGAVLFVPDDFTGSAARSRLVLGAGMHLLAHGDSVEVGGATIWLSAEPRPQRSQYDSELHGSDVFCFRSKARLNAGEPIVICRGTPQRACDMIYKEAAWEIGIPCHNCRFDPSQPSWRPPQLHERSSLDALFALARN